MSESNAGHTWQNLASTLIELSELNSEDALEDSSSGDDSEHEVSGQGNDDQEGINWSNFCEDGPLAEWFGPADRPSLQEAWQEFLATTQDDNSSESENQIRPWQGRP